jgi:hypothetical protein
MSCNVTETTPNNSRLGIWVSQIGDVLPAIQVEGAPTPVMRANAAVATFSEWFFFGEVSTVRNSSTTIWVNFTAQNYYVFTTAVVEFSTTDGLDTFTTNASAAPVTLVSNNVVMNSSNDLLLEAATLGATNLTYSGIGNQSLIASVNQSGYVASFISESTGSITAGHYKIEDRLSAPAPWVGIAAAFDPPANSTVGLVESPSTIIWILTAVGVAVLIGAAVLIALASRRKPHRRGRH